MTDRVPPLAGRLRAAVIGCGRIGARMDEDPLRRDVWTHAGAYRALPETDLVAAADPDTEARRWAAARWGIPRTYVDAADLLERERPEIVSVATPPGTHRDLVLEAIRAGVRMILCEKPLAPSREEAAEVVRAAEEAGATVAVNHVRRYDPLWRAARDLVASGRIGTVRGGQASYSSGLWNLGSHMIDALRFLLGEVSWVVGVQRPRGFGADPLVDGLLGFEGGPVVALLAAEEEAFLEFEVRILGERGEISIRGNGTSLEARTAAESPRYSGYRELGPAEPIPVSPGERMVSAVRDLIEAARDGRPPACSALDGLRAVEVIEGLQASGGRRVDLAPAGAAG